MRKQWNEFCEPAQIYQNIARLGCAWGAFCCDAVAPGVLRTGVSLVGNFAFAGDGGDGEDNSGSGSGSGSGDDDNSGPGGGDDDSDDDDDDVDAGDDGGNSGSGNSGSGGNGGSGGQNWFILNDGTRVEIGDGGREIKLFYANGWREEIRGGRYVLRDDDNRLVVDRAVTEDDYARLQGLLAA